MRIHETECQYYNSVSLPNSINPVHPINEILVVVKHTINNIAISVKMPTVSDLIVFTLDIRGVQRKVGLYLSEQVIICLHLLIQRL